MDQTKEHSERWESLRQLLRIEWANEATSVGAIIGCSGGADSVALVRLLVDRYRTQYAAHLDSMPPLWIAHFNHRLRGEQSDADEQFVRELAADLDVPIEVGRAQHDAAEDAEASLRQDRRDFFLATAAKSGCRYVALAHTLDDQSETVLHHLLRGTGTLGLKGMSSSRTLGYDFVIRRPLLRARRTELREALREIGQPWREDPSNEQTRYTRNWIRHDALPLLRSRFPKADHALVRAAENQTQLDGLIGRLARQWIESFVVIDDADADTDLCNRTSFQTIRFSRPSMTSSDSPISPWKEWPHSWELANEIPLITAACQILFSELDWPRRDMNRHHWTRLAMLIAEQPADVAGASNASGRVGDEHSISQGHWPGRIEGFQSARVVMLRRETKTEFDT
ncbi:tRNA lysidine(34) synthetase TilS [Rhodopirellula sp. SWK7]|uniref:tRNA lysidine(34) synthetase TilS n=1 Tax=Rhodopirellula sp. SWK7 TaxID=595460 RepID=UPI0002BDFC35|nr:tRNA lysidine(34) synthetase TilS [Rhodopirellula sp. SWK7]EMI47229.1 tRNA(ile)-lysidine synthase [Rhodopirellula sp. SWK7]